MLMTPIDDADKSSVKLRLLVILFFLINLNTYAQYFNTSRALKKSDESQTEAGFVGHHVPQYYVPDSYVRPAQTQKDYSSLASTIVSPENGMMTTIGGMSAMFGQAALIFNALGGGQAGASPKVSGECIDCKKKPEEINYDLTTQTQIDESDAIIDEFANEEVLPFSSEVIDTKKRDENINLVKESLDIKPFDSVLNMNIEEYENFCPNYKELKPSQRKAFFIYFYSQLFKQTSSYNESKRSLAVSSSQVTNDKIGLCALTYKEATSYYNKNKESFGFELIKEDQLLQPNINIQLCTAKIYNTIYEKDFNFKENKRGTAKYPSDRIQKSFPEVNFDLIKEGTKKLKLCQKIKSEDQVKKENQGPIKIVPIP